jgi:transcriptional regulator with XRE-family HTH domain
MSINNFGRDIKALRTKRGIGSRELSRLIGKAETYISQLERGLIKKNDYNTAFAIMKHLGFKDSGIEDFLYDYHQIKSPERIESEAEEVANWEEKRVAEIEAMIVQKQDTIDINPEYQENIENNNLDWFESEWMKVLYQQLESKNEEIKRELSFNLEKNMKTFESVLENLHSLITSMRKDKGNFDFFVGLFENDLSILDEESKGKILKVVKEEMDKHGNKI